MDALSAQEKLRAPLLIMGVLNVTPDSFSDGGQFLSKQTALEQARKLIADGADIIDVGGESSRPGAEPVSVQEELDRTIPVIEALASAHPVVISIDTYKSQVAAEAVRAGARLINDITSGSDPRMLEVAASTQTSVLLMHMQGLPKTMQEDPQYPKGVVEEVRMYLQLRAEQFQRAGLPSEQIWIDPGIGFGKTLAHNIKLLAELDTFLALGYRLAIGTSRKSFLARLLGNPALPFAERSEGTLATNLWALEKGSTVFRVHDVLSLRRAIETWQALQKGRTLAV